MNTPDQYATIKVTIPNRMTYTVTWLVDDNQERQDARISIALEKIESHIRDKESTQESL